MKVWKFEIIDPETPVAMPNGAKVLSVGVQRERVCIWALVNPNEPATLRRFVIVPTGAQKASVPGKARGGRNGSRWAP